MIDVLKNRIKNLPIAQQQQVLANLSKMPERERIELMSLVDEIGARKQRKIAQGGLLDFIDAVYPNYKVGAHHKRLAKLLEEAIRGDKKRIIVNIAPRMGKLIADETPVWTPTGWATHGELSIGDYVYHPEGHAVKVIAISAKAPANIRMDFTNGESIWCHEAHEWKLYNVVRKQWEIKEAGHFLRATKTGPHAGTQKQIVSGDKKKHYLHKIPVVKALVNSEKALTVHPYVLGAWLGDGSAGKACVTHSAADQIYVDKIAACGYPISAVCVHNTTGAITTYFSGTVGKSGRLTKELQTLGVYKNKHIPEIYKQGSIAQRLEVLAGLIDTDGCTDKQGRVKITTVNPVLVADIVDIVDSLGWRAYVQENQPRLSSSGIQGKKIYWDVGFQPTTAIPVALVRKQPTRHATQRMVGLSGVTLDAQNKVGHCIQVDSPDGLYVIGKKMITTHNSELVSYLFPAWFLGHHPDKKIIMATHTADLSVNFGRRVRDLVNSPEYKDVFPKVALNPDAKAAGQWNTSDGGQYYAAGVGGALAGRGADVFVIDDPHSEQQGMSGNAAAFLPAWEWFQSGPLQRLMPNGVIIVVMCMTGDTDVLMGDGTSNKLKDIRPGDVVATYENGQLTTAKINNWRSSGIDSIYTVRTQSGIMFKANERHPFLVDIAGEQKWTRLKDLLPGMKLVSLKAATDHQGHKQKADFVRHANPKTHTIKNALTRPTTQLGIMVNGKAKYAYMMDVPNQLNLKDIVVNTIAGFAKKMDTVRHQTHQKNDVINDLNIGTELHKQGLTNYLKTKKECALYASNHQPSIIPVHTGTTSYASTTTTKQELLEAYFVTTATLPLDTQKQQLQQQQSKNTSDFTTDKIISITASGREEVYDVEVDRTENFIANGVVSHNTRWSMMDLTGQLTNHMIKNPDADQWEVVEFPAILDENLPTERSLWPEFWPLEELKKKRAGMDVRYWSSQYLQNPTAEGAQLIKKEWWKHWDKEDPPQCEYTIMSLDAAQESHNRADYNAITHWGIFFNEETNQNNIMLLNAWKARMEFPELKRRMIEEYKEWEPDTFIVEKKSSGAALYQELRSMGMPVSEFTPSRGNDKISRVNSIADLFASGIVWAPTDRRWAQEVITECAEFPVGQFDDFVDSVSQALIRFRKGGFIRLPSDEIEDDVLYRYKKKAAYY